MHPATHARINPDKPACIMASSGETITYAELERRANQGAHQLRALGLQRGDVFAMLLDNEPTAFELAWSAQRAGLYVTAISNKLSAADILYIVQDAGAKVLIAANRFAAVAQQAAETLGVAVFLAGDAEQGLPSWRDARNARPGTPIADQSPGADMLYSSGTTGRPKGVKPALPEGPLDGPSPLVAMAQGLWHMDGDSVYLSTSPLYHAAPLRWGMVAHRLGAVVIIMENFDAEAMLQLVAQHRVTHTTCVPTHFVRLLKLPAEVREAYDMSSLRAVVHAAAPCPVPVKQAMIDWLGPVIYEYYSGTETCGITALDSREWLEKPGSVGRALLGTLKIVSDEGEVLGPGAVGNVYFADGPRFEYHNDPAKTAQAYNDRGWATLGDIGQLDEDGFLFLTDRKSFMIISGGVNIYPQEIENHIVTHPAVADVAVIGAPDEDMGERVVAVVEPMHWADAGPALEAELRAFTTEVLGKLKCPRQFDFMEKLPREPTGKLMKRVLRDEYWRRAGKGSAA